ncbi:hypothetical protein VTK73DRAFT_7765 [Phialemonium thermophilum]|uniref:Amidase domain-containing protein n=1 Tax=Phialemonium thermophilum TaxID=223376 RepID=A0ABR3XSM0_9PEZI
MSHKVESFGIGSLLEGYDTGRFTPAEVVNVVYDRIDTYGDKAVWITLVSREDALVRAAQLQSGFRDRRASMTLYGIPFSVKDAIDVAGYPTTMACPSFAYLADETAVVVRRILDAGGIFVGKTNLDQFGLGLVGNRSPYGTPRCVYDPDHVSGGSSSGSAVSVAASLVSFSVATDMAGNTLVPAALNGIVAFKPTLGTLSTVGLVPTCRAFDCVAIAAKSTEDLRTAWVVMKSYDEDDIFSRASLPLWPRAWRPDACRFGTPPEDLLARLPPDYRRLFDAAANAMVMSLGLERSKSFDYAPFHDAGQMYPNSSLAAQNPAALEDFIAEHGAEELHPATRDILAASRFDAVQAYRDLFAVQYHRRRAELQYRDNIDVLLVPSTVVHPTADEIYENPTWGDEVMGAFTHFINLLDLCAVAVPAGVWRNSRGAVMPFGVIVIGQAGTDEGLLELGSRLTDVL